MYPSLGTLNLGLGVRFRLAFKIKVQYVTSKRRAA